MHYKGQGQEQMKGANEQWLILQQITLIILFPQKLPNLPWPL